MITSGEKLARVCGIYCAIHRESRNCYVGSSVNIGCRRNQHIHSIRSGSQNRFHCFVREFGEEAFDFEVLERCDKRDLFSRESFYISLLGATGIDGLNSQDARPAKFGLVNHPLSRLRQSQAMKGRKLSPDTIAKRTASRAGYRHSKETIEKMRAAKMGHSVSADARAKIGAASKGRRHNDEAKKKIILSSTGRKMSDDTRARMSAAQKGRVVSNEARAKISAALTGNKLSAESISKRTAKQKGLRRTPEQIQRMKAGRIAAALLRAAKIEKPEEATTT